MLLFTPFLPLIPFLVLVLPAKVFGARPRSNPSAANNNNGFKHPDFSFGDSLSNDIAKELPRCTYRAASFLNTDVLAKVPSRTIEAYVVDLTLNFETSATPLESSFPLSTLCETIYQDFMEYAKYPDDKEYAKFVHNRYLDECSTRWRWATATGGKEVQLRAREWPFIGADVQALPETIYRLLNVIVHCEEVKRIGDYESTEDVLQDYYWTWMRYEYQPSGSDSM